MTFIQIDAVTSDRLLIIWRMFDWWNGTLHPKWICGRWNRNPCSVNYTKIGLNVSEVILASIVLFFYPLLGFLVVPRYTLLSYFSAVKSLDYVTNGIEHYTSLHIISAKVEEIKF
jgi:hypothetical protein